MENLRSKTTEGAAPMCPGSCVHLKWANSRSQYGCFPDPDAGKYILLDQMQAEPGEAVRYVRSVDCPLDRSCRVSEQTNKPGAIAEGKRLLKVYTVVHRPGEDKGIWLEVGIASRSDDGSLAVRLDATPTNGTLRIKEE